MARSSRHRSASLAIAVVLALIAGCSADDGVAEDPYQADIEHARENATSELERAILSDGVITRDDYEQAVSAYVECVRDQGFDIEPVDQSGYYVFQTRQDSDAYWAVSDECERGTIELIAGIYIGQLTNPERLDSMEVRVKCFRDQGLVDGGYTVEDWRRDAGENFVNAPYDSEDDQLKACLANPSAPEMR